MNQQKQWRWLPPLSLFALFLLYTFTRLPSVGLIDSGEISLGCYQLNILHPTGYPLFTLLGRIFSLLPVGTVHHRLTTLTGMLTISALGLFFLIGKRLNCHPLTTTTVVLLLGISTPVWSVSTDVEVYSLTLGISALLWLTIVEIERPNIILIFAYLAGLILTNHLTGTWTVIGATTTLILIKRRHLSRSLLWLIPVFLLGLSPYLTLLIRAQAQPLISWGNPVNIERLLWHITGRQYRVWMFTLPFASVLKNIKSGLLLLLHTFGYLLIPAVIYGWYILIRKNLPLAIGLTTTIILTIIYSANYAIPDIEAYYLPAVVALGIITIFGINSLLVRYGKKIHLLGIIPLAMAIVNFRVQNKSDNWVAYDQAVNTLQSADTNGIIITDWWDIYSPALYLQEIEKVRTDVCIIDKELLRRTWYFDFLKKKYPWLIENSRYELQTYLKHLYRFEYKKPFDPVAIQNCYITLLRSFVINNPTRSAYTTFPPDADNDARELWSGFNPVPVGILFQMRTDTVIPRFNYHQLTVRIPRFGIDERTRINLERYQVFVRWRQTILKEQHRFAEAQQLENWYQTQFLNLYR